MKVIIVGAVAAGATLATSLRRLDENIEIVMYEKDRDMSFGNCELPYYLSYEIKNSNLLVHRDSQKFDKNYNIKAKNHHEVLSIDRENKTIRVLDKVSGEEFEDNYDYLVLATGAHPNVPKSIKDTDQENVFTIRNVVDVERIRAFYEKNHPKEIFIAGGGFIAIEAAHALNELKDTHVSIFVRGKILGVIDDELKPFIEENIIENGVDIIHENELIEIKNNKAIFASGRKVAADMVILALGMAANNKLAIDAGLSVTQKGSIVTDDDYKTSDPNIFAIGDVIDVKNFFTNKKQNLKLAWPAHRQAKYVANIIAGEKNDKVQSFIGTFLIKSFDLNIGVTGLSEENLKDLSYNFDTTIISHTDIVETMPKAEMVYMKLLFDKDSGKIYGAQAISKGVVDKRIDVIGTLIKMGGTIYDLYDLELGYQPYYSTTEDINNVLGSQAINIKEGRLLHERISNLKDVLDDYEIYDIRNEVAYKQGHIKNAKHYDGNIEEFAEIIPKDKKVLIYDDIGTISSNLIKRLQNMGINNVFTLDGGMFFLQKYDKYLNLKLISHDKK